MSERTSEFFGALAAASFSLLLLDYDGTLAPFTVNRLEAVPYPGVKDRLKQLLCLTRTRLILISGRQAHELRDLINLSQSIEIWGSHGRERLGADGTYLMDQLTAYEQAGLHHVRQALETDFSADVVEVKPNSVAVHWRNASGTEDAAKVRSRMQQVFGALPQAPPGDGVLQLLPFDGGLELRAGVINKGHAVKRILEQFPAETPAAFLGDDLTDEDAFAVLRERGLAVLVKREPRETLARLWLSPPDDLLHFLDAWIEAVETPR